MWMICHKCNFEWRSHHTDVCPHCERNIGSPIILDELQAAELMKIVQIVGCGDDEDDYDLIVHLLEETEWYKDEIWWAQACYLYLSTQTDGATPDVDHLMEFFENVFRQSIASLAMRCA